MTSIRIVVFVILCLPSALASGDSLPISVIYDNGKSANCVAPATDVCLVALTGEGGDTRLDMNQDLRRVAILVDGEAINARTGVPLLPDGRFGLDLTQFDVEHPVFVLLSRYVGDVRGPREAQSAGVFVTERRYGASMESIDGPNETGSTERGIWFSYAEHNGVGYERVGPFDVISNSSTDRRVELAPQLICNELNDSECERDMAELSADVKTLAPEIAYGLTLAPAEVGTRLDDATHGAGLASRGGSADLGPREGSAPLPQRLPPPSSPLKLSIEAQPTTSADHSPFPRQPARPANPPSGARISDASTDPHSPSPLLPLAATLVLALLAALLYSRLGRREQALAHPTRLRILRLIAERPRTLTELARELGVDPTTALYHVRLLEKTEHLAMRGRGRHTFVCPPGQQAPEAPPSAAERVGDELLRILGEAGGALPRAELHARAASIPAWARNEALRVLARAGRIARGFAGDTEIVRVAGG